MALLLRSSSAKSGHCYLRKKRKWPLSPYKTRWQETFGQQQAMEALEKAASAAPKHQHDGGEEEREPCLLLSTLVESFRTYRCDPTPAAYHFLIKTLTLNSQLHQLPQVLNRLEDVERFETPVRIFVNLIRIYGIAGKFQEAVELFFRIPNFRCAPSVHSLNALLSVLCKSRKGLRFIPKLLLKSRDMNIRIEESSLGILVAVLCRIRKPASAIEILRFMLNDGCSLNARACSLVLSTLCEQKELSSEKVLQFLDELRRVGFVPGRLDYSNVIRLLVKENKGMDALDVLNQMKVEGIKPDIACYTMALSGIIEEGDFAKAEELFDEILVLGLIPDIYTYNAYINGLCKQNNLEAGFKMLSCMEELGCKPNLITYNTLLETLCKVGDIRGANELVKEMELKGLQQNSQTYGILIAGLVTKGENFEACSMLEEMLNKCFLPEPSTVDDIICGLCQRCLVFEAIDLLQKLVDRGAIGPGAKAWELLLTNSALEFTSVQFILTDIVKSAQAQLVVWPEQTL